jgi:hypothetical protein
VEVIELEIAHRVMLPNLELIKLQVLHVLAIRDILIMELVYVLPVIMHVMDVQHLEDQ